MTITDAGPGRPRRRMAAFAALAVLSVMAVALPWGSGGHPPGPGGELDLKPGHAYGWYASKTEGSLFTDGLTTVGVTLLARGPVRLVSARPLMDDGGAVRVIGVLARVNPDMLPAGSQVGGFQDSPGFPPVMRDAAGAVPIKGLVVEPPKPRQDRWIELQIGYEVVAPGRSVRRGVELVYEYGGARRVAVIPSYLAICAPATVTCPPEYDS